MKAEIERLENGWEMKCPYKDGDEYFFFDEVGSLIESRWDGLDRTKTAFHKGQYLSNGTNNRTRAKRQKPAYKIERS